MHVADVQIIQRVKDKRMQFAAAQSMRIATDAFERTKFGENYGIAWQKIALAKSALFPKSLIYF